MEKKTKVLRKVVVAKAEPYVSEFGLDHDAAKWMAIRAQLSALMMKMYGLKE